MLSFLAQKLLIAVCGCRLSLMGHLIVDVSDNEMCTVNVIWTYRVRPVSSVLADTGTAFKSERGSGHITVINVLPSMPHCFLTMNLRSIYFLSPLSVFLC